jgi:hypothetical protein
MNQARDLLRALTFRLPPATGKHHSILLRDDDPAGLDLLVWVGERGQMVHLDQDDLEKTPDELASGVVAVVAPSPAQG